MRRRIELLRRLIRLIDDISLAILITFFAGIIVAKHVPKLPLLFTVAGVYIFSYLVREKASNVWIIILHIVLAAICATLPVELLARVMPAAFLLVYLIPASLLYAGRGGTIKAVDEAPWPQMLACVVFDLYGYAAKSPVLMRVSYIVLLIYLFNYFLCLFMDGASVYLGSAKDVSGLPVRRMVRVNTLLVLGIVFILALGIFFTRNVDLSQELKSLLSFLVLIIKAIASVVLTFVLLVMTFFGGLGNGSAVEQTRNNLIQEEDVANSSDFIEFLFSAMFFIIAGFILYHLLSMVLRYLLKKRRPKTDIVEVIEKKTDTKTEQYGSKKSVRSPFSKLSRARRHYKEQVMRYKNEISLTPSKTCHEISNDIASRELGDLAEITEIYEEIRYNDAEVTRPMLRALTRMSRM